MYFSGQPISGQDRRQKSVGRNVLGSEVATLVDEEQPSGNYSIIFDTTNNPQLTTNSLPSGVYLYQLRAGNFVETKKLVITK